MFRETAWTSRQTTTSRNKTKPKHTYKKIQTTEPDIMKIKCILLDRTTEINAKPICIPPTYGSVHCLWWKIPEGWAGDLAARGNVFLMVSNASTSVFTMLQNPSCSKSADPGCGMSWSSNTTLLDTWRWFILRFIQMWRMDPEHVALEDPVRRK